MTPAFLPGRPLSATRRRGPPGSYAQAAALAGSPRAAAEPAPPLAPAPEPVVAAPRGTPPPAVMLAQARAMMDRTGGQARLAAAHVGAAAQPGGWTYSAVVGGGLRTAAWSDRLAEARARADAARARGVADPDAAPRPPIRLEARAAALVLGPAFGDDAIEPAPGQSLVLAFAQEPPGGLAAVDIAVDIAADEDAMRVAIADGPAVRLRGLDRSGRVALVVGGEEIELSPGARRAAVDARI